MSTATARMAEVRTLGSYDAVHAAFEAFEAKVEARTVTIMDIVEYILTIDEAGFETIPQSMGMQWIHRNPARFAGIVDGVDRFVERLLDLAEINPMNEGEDVKAWDGLRALRYWFFRSFICSKELMALLSTGWRETFVRDLYPKVGANNHAWISAAILHGVFREMIAKAIMERLKRVKIEKGVANDVEDFLRYGGGDIHGAPIHVALRSLGVEQTALTGLREAIRRDPTTGFPEIERRLREGVQPRESTFGGFPEIPPWFVLNNAELAEALQHCATKAPAETLNVLLDERISPRIKLDDVDQIVTIAYRRVTSLSGVNIQTLERLLTLSSRETLARQLVPVESHHLHKATAQFLFMIVYELPREKREKFWESVVVPVLKPVAASTLYCAWRQMKMEEDDIETALLLRLDEEGYILGTITRGRHPKGGIQWMVEANGHTYVQSRDQHRYFPAEGDLVLYKREGHFLTPSVTAVHFIPVMKDVR